MVRFGQFIRLLERLQRPHPVFFMAENVVLRKDDMRVVKDAFGFDWDPINLDALYFSPARRNRHFFTNIPLDFFEYDTPLSELGPTSCLEDGYRIPAHILDPDVKAKVRCAEAFIMKLRLNEGYSCFWWLTILCVRCNRPSVSWPQSFVLMRGHHCECMFSS